MGSNGLYVSSNASPGRGVESSDSQDNRRAFGHTGNLSEMPKFPKPNEESVVMQFEIHRPHGMA
jgi:hypothetical protein